MTTITFTIPGKYEHEKTSINQMINLHKGDFISKETKDGCSYSIDFENDDSGKEFYKKLKILIPDIYKY